MLEPSILMVLLPMFLVMSPTTVPAVFVLVPGVGVGFVALFWFRAASRATFLALIEAMTLLGVPSLSSSSESDSLLDQALLSGPAAAAKYTSFLAAGMLLPVSFQAAPLAVQAFFVGNWVWMTATVGLLYQNTPQQLCVNYLIGTQLNAGEGLVAAALAIAGLWCVYAVPVYRDS